jgi:hypothetical protein
MSLTLADAVNVSSTVPPASPSATVTILVPCAGAEESGSDFFSELHDATANSPADTSKAAAVFLFRQFTMNLLKVVCWVYASFKAALAIG